MSKKPPTDEQLRAAARHTYGTACSQIFCKAGGGLTGGDRDISLPDDLRVDRDEALEGTWITARIWIADGDIE